MEGVHTRDKERMQNLDSKVRKIYPRLADLVNDGMEIIRGDSKVVSALNVGSSKS